MRSPLLLALSLVAAPMILSAQTSSMGEPPMSMAPDPFKEKAPSPAPVIGWRHDFLRTLSYAENHYLRLAEAIPQEKYDWRPAPGVRSIGEVLLHVANDTYLFSTHLGAKLPEGVNLGTIEASTKEKEAIVEQVKMAFALFKRTLYDYPEKGADQKVRWFGNRPQITAREFLFQTAEHNGEHLGQLIAYARMNGVVPPWSK